MAPFSNIKFKNNSIPFLLIISIILLFLPNFSSAALFNPIPNDSVHQLQSNSSNHVQAVYKLLQTHKELLSLEQILRLNNLGLQNSKLNFNLDEDNSSSTTVNPTTQIPIAEENCVNHLIETLTKFLAYFSGNSKEIWPVQMADAWGKIPSGILRGHTAELGDFDQCLAITATNERFKGKYCTLHLLLNGFLAQDAQTEEISVSGFEKPTLNPNIALGLHFSPTLGICLPSSCSEAEIQNLFNNVLNLIGISSLASACYVDEKPNYDAGVYFMIVFLAIIGFTTACATLLDLYHVYYIKKQSNDKKLNTKTRALLAFSAYTNGLKLLNTKTSEDSLNCLYGLRFLSICWVILGHTWTATLFNYNWNLIDMLNVHEKWSMMMILHGSLSVDTFFTIGGVLVSYTLLKMFDKTKGYINLPFIYLHRYLRLTPTYAILIGLSATFTPYLSTGPSWNIIQAFSYYCRKNWWHNLLYINNMMKYKLDDAENGQCFGESWYLANDMQFFIVATMVVWVLWKWSRVGVFLLGFFTIGSIVAPGVLTSEKDLPPTSIFFREAGSYNEDVYIKPWTRCGPYIIGLWTGYFIHLISKRTTNFKLNRWILTMGWVLATITALSLIFSPHDWFNPTIQISKTYGVIYAAFHRALWAVVISWIIFACVLGSGGVINKFLSWSLFMPLGRLTFCIYLVSLELQLIYHARLKQTMIYDVYNTVYVFFGHVFMSVLISGFLTILFESPFLQLEKIFVGERLKTKSSVELKEDINVDRNQPVEVRVNDDESARE